MAKIGILTGGGDCPGLNAVIRAVVKTCANNGVEVFGFHKGWFGVLQGEGHWMDRDEVENIHTLGGTVLHTSRTNVMKFPDGPEMVAQQVKALELDCVIAIGGDDTLGVADALNQRGIPMVGVPKTIDNDLNGTDFCFGFDTACNIAMEAIDRIQTTALSHERYIVVELMGRHTGWIAAYAGLAGGACVVALPEFQMTVEDICDIVRARHARGLDYGVIAVAEGCNFPDMDDPEVSHDDFGNVRLPDLDLGKRLAAEIRKRTGSPTRHVVLGHLQRGGAPSCFDRVLGTRLGYMAAKCALTGDYGKMVAIKGNEIVALPLSTASAGRHEVDAELYECVKLNHR